MKAELKLDNNMTTELELIEKPLPFHLLGKTFTASGYGKRIPTRFMVKYKSRLKRVYCHIYSNTGTCYIEEKGKKLTIREV